MKNPEEPRSGRDAHDAKREAENGEARNDHSLRILIGGPNCI